MQDRHPAPQEVWARRALKFGAFLLGVLVFLVFFFLVPDEWRLIATVAAGGVGLVGLLIRPARWFAVGVIFACGALFVLAALVATEVA